MLDICSICIKDIKENETKKVLSCNHVFHYKCFIKVVYHNKNFFIHCPLCRRMNDNVSKPFTEPIDNIKILCSKNNSRCKCMTKNNRRCKRKSVLLNYGYCQQHNTSVLKKEYYPLMERYLYYILIQRNTFPNKLQLFDIGKKLIMKFCNENTSIEELFSYFYKYFSFKNISYIKDYDDLYEFYDLEIPPLDWITDCLNNVIFY